MITALFIGAPGPTELIVIAIIVLLIFGPTQIPKLTKMFGKGVKSFKKGMADDEESDDSDDDSDDEEKKSTKKSEKKSEKKSKKKDTDEE